MNWLDVAVVITLVTCVVTGIREGFSRSGFGLMTILAAFVSAAWLFPSNAKAFLAAFVAVICLAALIGFLIGRQLKRTGPLWLDRGLGAAFGLVNAALIAVLGVLALMAFAPKAAREYVAGSEFAPYAVEAAQVATAVVPREVKLRVEESYAELVHVLPPKVRQAMPPAEI